MKTFQMRVFTRIVNLEEYINNTKAEVIKVETVSDFWNGTRYFLQYYSGENESDIYGGKANYLEGDGFYYTKTT